VVAKEAVPNNNPVNDPVNDPVVYDPVKLLNDDVVTTDPVLNVAPPIKCDADSA
jgi:hypothetical protein